MGQQALATFRIAQHSSMASSGISSLKNSPSGADGPAQPYCPPLRLKHIRWHTHTQPARLPRQGNRVSGPLIFLSAHAVGRWRKSSTAAARPETSSFRVIAATWTRTALAEITSRLAIWPVD